MKVFLLHVTDKSKSLELVEIDNKLVQNGDVCEFLIRQGYDMSSTLWNKCPEEGLPIEFTRIYDFNGQTEKDTILKDNVKFRAVYEQVDAIKEREQNILRERIKRHGTRQEDGSITYDFAENCLGQMPIVHLFDEADEDGNGDKFKHLVKSVSLDDQGNLSMMAATQEDGGDFFPERWLDELEAGDIDMYLLPHIHCKMQHEDQ